MAQKSLDEYYAEIDELREFIKSTLAEDPSRTVQWAAGRVTEGLTSILADMGKGATERAKARRKKARERAARQALLNELPFDA